VLRIGKRRLTIPRLGWVKFGPKAETRRRRVIVVLAIGVVLMAALIPLTILMRSRPLLPPDLAGAASPLMALAVALVVWGVLSLMAAFWEFSRLYFHALIVGVSFFAVEMLNRGWPLLVGSTIVIAIGIGYLIRFLKAYPKPAPEADRAQP
jgi:hypothetical protein